MPSVSRIIHQQHRAMASVLFALRALTRQALRSGNRPDFRWLRMLAEFDPAPLKLRSIHSG